MHAILRTANALCVFEETVKKASYIGIFIWDAFFQKVIQSNGIILLKHLLGLQGRNIQVRVNYFIVLERNVVNQFDSILDRLSIFRTLHQLGRS
jgi:hypothetical protein